MPTFESSGIVYTDREPFFINNVEKAYLKITRYHGDGLWGIMYIEEDYVSNDWIGDASREKIKCAVYRLPAFLEAYAKELDERTETYREVSEIANKMLINIKKE